MKKHKILILIDRLGRGGVAQVAMNTALSLDPSKYSPIICTTRNVPAHGHDTFLRQAGIQLIELKRTSRWQLSSWKKLWQILPTVSLLHTHQSGSNFWGRIWGKLFRVPIIITQDHTAANEKPKLQHLLDRFMGPLSDRIITVSEYDRDLSITLEKLPPNKVMTIYNGIDVSKFRCELPMEAARQQTNLPQDKRLIAVIARLAPQKNHQNLFNALTLLPEKTLANLHCLIVGSGDLEEQLRQEVQKLGLMEKMSFLGERSDIPEILRAIDMLVLSSHWECLPIILLEALASGCPVVATAVGGIPEAMESVDWPLVEPDNSMALAEAIMNVFQKSAMERDKIVKTGRQVAQKKFSKEASVSKVEKLYTSLLDKTFVK